MLRIDTRRTPRPDDHTATAWTGVLVEGERTIANCGHAHLNRLTLTGVPVDNALDCVTTAVRAIRFPDALDFHRRHLLHAADAFDTPPGTPGHLGADAVRNLVTGRITVIAQAAERLADIVCDQPVWGQGGYLLIPPTPPTVPCRTCGVRLIARRWRPRDGGWTHWVPAPIPPSAPDHQPAHTTGERNGQTDSADTSAATGSHATPAAPPDSRRGRPRPQPHMTPDTSRSETQRGGTRTLCIGSADHVPAFPHDAGPGSGDITEM